MIELLAREGGRGLTHGNVDTWLDLPKGSTSFYFRRRAELFEAGLRKRAAAEYGYLFLSVTLANFFVPPAIRRHRITTAYYERCLREIAYETNQLPTVAVESVRRGRSRHTRRQARSRG